MGITVTHVKDDFTQATRGRIKMLVVGQPGSGKTRSASTWPNPLFMDAEGGMLSVRDRDVRATKITSLADMDELRTMLTQTPQVRAELCGGPVDTLVVDTIDEIARIIIRERLQAEKHETMEMRDWGYLGDTLRSFVRGYRNLDLNVVFNVHVKSSEDNATGRVEYKPALQGAMGDELAGYVDLAVLLVARPTTDPVTNERVIRRYLQTFPDSQHDWLKDRSGNLPLEFPIDLDTDYERLATLIYGTQEELTKAAVDDLKNTAVKTRGKATTAPRKTKAETTVTEPPPPPPPPPPPAPEPDPEPPVESPIVDVPIDPEPVPEETVPDPGTDVPSEPAPELDDPLADLGAPAPAAVCSECGAPVTSRDHADFSMLRFETVLCREHFAARNAQKTRR